MKMIQTVKMLSAAAVMALSFAGNAQAVTITTDGHGTATGTGPQGDSIVVTGLGSGAGTWYRVPAVPEADTWAMMALGLGMVGLTLRRKSKKSQAA